MSKRTKCNALTIMFDVLENNTTAACDAAAFANYLKLRKKAPQASGNASSPDPVCQVLVDKIDRLGDLSDHLKAIFSERERPYMLFPDDCYDSWESYCVMEWFVPADNRRQARLMAKHIRAEARALGLGSCVFERFGPPPVCPYNPLDLAVSYSTTGFFLDESGVWKYNADFVM